MTYLLDTDWAIQALAGKQLAVNPLTELISDGIAISWITVREIYEGVFGFPDPQSYFTPVRAFIELLQKLDLDDLTMERFAAIRADLRRRGQLIPDFDLLTAATALRHDLTVLTYNLRHFSRIPALKLYK